MMSACPSCGYFHRGHLPLCSDCILCTVVILIALSLDVAVAAIFLSYAPLFALFIR